MANDFMDWDALIKASQDPTYGGIIDVLGSQKGSYRDIAGKEIMPLLQPGVDPYMQQAINEIVRQGKESKARTMADVGTAAQARGLTGSSIESGDIAQASYQQELGQQGQITGMLAQEAANKRDQMIQFLTQAYGMDFQRATQMAESLAQAMGQEMGRQQDWKMFGMAQRQEQRNQPGWLEQIMPALITGGAIVAASDRRLKKNIVRIGNVRDIPVYEFDYDHSKMTGLPEGKQVGVMSDEVRHIPGAVIVKDGYDYVDYNVIFK